jgi:undecaprenyl diphosphate synthase
MSPLDPHKLPRHVAIIMDGNGRWARKRLLNRIAGHQEGSNSVRAVVRKCRELNIPHLTLYAFSKENWQRPPLEIKALWQLLRQFLKSELAEMMEQEIRLNHLGDIEDIPEDVVTELRQVVAMTACNDKLHLNLAINYGGRDELLRGARLFAIDVLRGKYAPDDLTQELFSGYLFTRSFPEPDLLIRTSGENRISNFLLWQLAYTEIYFTEVLWPDFREAEFLEALLDYQRRERRFGKTSEQLIPLNAEVGNSRG